MFSFWLFLFFSSNNISPLKSFLSSFEFSFSSLITFLFLDISEIKSSLFISFNCILLGTISDILSFFIFLLFSPTVSITILVSSSSPVGI